jgi:O-antigen/teichoic acid export membrane protein
MMEEDLSNSGPGRLVSGGAWFLALMILSGFFWLVLGIQVGNTYGPAGFGLFNTVYSVFDFLWALIFGGLFEGLIHFGACYLTKKDSNLARYFSNYVRYLTMMSLIIFTVLTVLAIQTSNLGFRTILLSLAFAFLFSGTKDSLSSILGSLHKSKQLSIIQSTGFYAVTIIGIIFAFLLLPSELLPTLVLGIFHKKETQRFVNG